MALLSEKEKEQLNRVLAEYPNSEDLDLYYIQVDIWSKEDCFRLKKKVKKLLKKAGFTYFTGNDQYEVETGIYHKAARFYFSMNVEGEN